MKNNMLNILPFALLLDLLIPFLLAPAYKGYNHLTQVMSALGNAKAPLHAVYNAWLIVLGIVLIINNFIIYKVVSKHSTFLGVLLFIAILNFAVCSLVCFILAVIFFTLFIMADKPNFQNTIIAYEGLWQRLSLMFMYIPIACMYFSFSTKGW